jgi:hypothetical protein
MKANAPEKIYLLHDDRYVDDLSIIWFEAPYATGSIEYSRTDAFIEKAWSWIENNMLSSNQQDKSRFYYEQFRNYIKGE